jgi:alcohol dehydrogenase class IV
MIPFNNSFKVARLPAIHFADGAIDTLPQLIAGYRTPVLLVTGRASFLETAHWKNLTAALDGQGTAWQQLGVADEPSPQRVDEAVQRFAKQEIGLVVGIGGGSVLDAAKAVAGLLPSGRSVMDHLEGVGRGIPYAGPALPWIAVPTTAGTGSEATKNAVLSVRGKHGFKKSFRDERLVAEVALVDPQLLQSCPPILLAANGMDAFTQLLESWVSLRASPFTDALASSGMQAFRDGFWPAWNNAKDAAEGRTRMAYASLCSGITLAQAGLGSVHGLASPLGAFFPIPHGVVCGTLVAEATRVNIEVMRQRDPGNPALRRYAEAGLLLGGVMYPSEQEAQDALVSLLREWTERLQLPRLSHFGMSDSDLPRVIANCRGGSMQTNPIELTDQEVEQVLLARL